VSAVGQESVVEEGIGLGAATYIVKPFTVEGLVAAVNGVFLD
jgi:two-component system, chemotaxis family, chemotaxis protein CheY